MRGRWSDGEVDRACDLELIPVELNLHLGDHGLCETVHVELAVDAQRNRPGRVTPHTRRRVGSYWFNSSINVSLDNSASEEIIEACTGYARPGALGGLSNADPET